MFSKKRTTFIAVIVLGIVACVNAAGLTNPVVQGLAWQTCSFGTTPATNPVDLLTKIDALTNNLFTFSNGEMADSPFPSNATIREVVASLVPQQTKQVASNGGQVWSIGIIGAIVGIFLFGMYFIVQYRDWRIGLYLGAWASALLAVGIPLVKGGCYKSLWIAAHNIQFFPIGFLMGLAYFFPILQLIKVSNSLEMPFLFGSGYIFYIVHVIITFRFCRRTRFAIMYVILLVALAANIVGCHGFLSGR